MPGEYHLNVPSRGQDAPSFKLVMGIFASICNLPIGFAEDMDMQQLTDRVQAYFDTLCKAHQQSKEKHEELPAEVRELFLNATGTQLHKFGKDVGRIVRQQYSLLQEGEKKRKRELRALGGFIKAKNMRQYLRQKKDLQLAEQDLDQRISRLTQDIADWNEDADTILRVEKPDFASF